MNRRHVMHLGVLALALCACGRDPGDSEDLGDGQLAAPPTSPESFGEVVDFEFLERRGANVRRSDLLGAPWLVGFIFTRCSTICPGLAAEMSRAHEALVALEVPVVAISVDPEHDTPAELTRFAESYRGSESEHWMFLTGDEAATHDLIRTSFHLAVERNPGADPGMAISHSSLLVAVDGNGLIRGYYDGATPDGTEQAIARVRFLAGDRSGLSPLPGWNALLNGSAALLLALGFVAIKSGRRVLHARLMRTAFLISAAFLASYLYYHFVVVPAQGGPVRFSGSGAARGAYLALLLTHILGAVVNLPMVLRTLWLAHRERWDDHRRLARRTFPLWMYVSITGVCVYLVLYRF